MIDLSISATYDNSSEEGRIAEADRERFLALARENNIIALDFIHDAVIELSDLYEAMRVTMFERAEGKPS